MRDGGRAGEARSRRALRRPARPDARLRPSRWLDIDWELNGPCFRGTVFAEAFTGDDPLFRHVRTRVRSPQTNGVVERFFGTLKYEHLYRAVIGDGNALAVEINCFRHTYNTLRPHQALNDWTPRQVYLTSRESQ
jgi:putative transposase